MKLSERGFDDAIVQEALDVLTQQRLLSDSRATEAMIQMRSGKRAVGREALQEELRQRGADEAKLELAERTDEQELAIMLEVIAKFEDRARAGRLLARRGFDPELIASVLERHFGEED